MGSIHAMLCFQTSFNNPLSYQAYKQEMYGKRYVWIIIGWYEDKWWEKSLDKENIECSPSEMSEAVEGYLATDHMKLNEDYVTSRIKTVSGWVRNISSFSSIN